MSEQPAEGWQRVASAWLAKRRLGATRAGKGTETLSGIHYAFVERTPTFFFPSGPLDTFTFTVGVRSLKLPPRGRRTLGFLRAANDEIVSRV